MDIRHSTREGGMIRPRTRGHPSQRKAPHHLATIQPSGRAASWWSGTARRAAATSPENRDGRRTVASIRKDPPRPRPGGIRQAHVARGPMSDSTRQPRIRDIYKGRVVHLTTEEITLPNGHRMELEI